MQLEFDRRCFAFAPDGERKNAGFLFRRSDGVAKTATRIVGEWLAKYAEDHIVHLQNTIGGRAFVHGGDDDLTRRSSEVLVAEIHPSAQARGAEEPVVRSIGLAASGEIWDRRAIGCFHWRKEAA